MGESAQSAAQNLQFFHVINGELVSSAISEKRKDPRTDEPLWDVPVAGQDELEAAVKAAQNAFSVWSKTPVGQRQEVLRKLAATLRENRDLMSAVVSGETGKSNFMGTLEIDDSIGFLEFNASQEIVDEVVFEDETLKIVETHTPLGVVGAICPWNFPLVLAVAKVAAALVTGNCIIVKPSPFTPYSILKFAELVKEILPAGVFQALNGDNSLGQSMVSSPGIQKISFTGSTATGKRIMQSASSQLKRLTLELGGNDPTIVCPDVDVAATASKVAIGCFFNAGQMCVATKRVYVHEDIYEEFMASFVKAAREIPVTISPEVFTTFGPIQNHMQRAIVEDLINDCKIKGYKLSYDEKDSVNGLVIKPIIVENPPDDSRVVKEEQFGPIIPVMSWKTEDEVVQRANASEAGLGACVWAKDLERAGDIGRRLEAGSVWINHYERPHPAGYFSGHKQSGIGGEWGKRGLLSYCNTQSLHFYK